MEGKRASSEFDDKESKRAKTDFPTEIVLEGIEYINLSCLLKTAPFAAYFAKHYKSVKRFLEEEKDIEVFTVSKQKIAKGVFEHKEAFSSGCDLRLVKKDGKITDFIERAQIASRPMAPTILVDGELAFTDTLGVPHDVEIRGKRTEEGIYFKVKDIGQVFGSSKLVENIQLEHTQLEENKDYVWFTIPNNERKKHGSTRELFFTARGLYNYCRTSKILNCSVSYGFIYLVHLGEEMYKFGKSWVLDSRLKTHKRTFKSVGFEDIKPVYSVKIDIKLLGAAEQAVKSYLKMHGWYRSTRYSSELCELDGNGLEQVKSYYDNLQSVHFTGTPYAPRFNAMELAEKVMRTLGIDDTVPHDEDAEACKSACVYLLETSIKSFEKKGIPKRVYKFGCSKSMKITYDHGSAIDTLIFLPVNYLSEAETKLKHTLGKKYTHEDSTETELLLLSDDERNTVRNAMRTVGETFYGETVVHTHQLEMLKKDHELEMSNKDQVLITAKKDVEVAKKDVEVAKKDVEVAKKDVEVAKRDIVILEMKNEIQARRIQELEEKLRRCKKNNANAA
jgi:hypothetical protein